MAKKMTETQIKKDAKLAISGIIENALDAQGMHVENGADYGFSEGTLVVNYQGKHYQVKMIATKAGVDHYEKIQTAEVAK